MFEGKNLLSMHASKPNKMVNALMSVLFTEEELAKGLIIEDIKNTRSQRIPLDLTKIKLLKNTLFIKYRTPESKQGKLWSEYINTANSFCRDCSAKAEKERQQQHKLNSHTSQNLLTEL